MANLAKFNATITNTKTQEYLDKVLGEKKDTFVATLTSLVANNKALQEVEPVTLMYSAIKAVSLNLPLDNNLGFAYVIPYKNNKLGVTEAQFQIGYKGFIQLALRSGKFRTLNVTDVRLGEISYYDRMTGEITFNWLDDSERAGKQVIGYLAYMELTNGFKKSLYMTVEQINKHALKYSQTYKRGYGNWKDNFEAMAEKTVLKLLLNKYAPLSVELIDAIKSDQAVIRDEQPDYIDNDRVIDIEEMNKDEEISRVISFIEKAKTLDELQTIQDQVPVDILDDVISAIDKKRNELQNT